MAVAVHPIAPPPAFHVAGVLVQVSPSFDEPVAAAIAQMPGARVHAAHAGRLVVTLESDDAASIVEAITGIGRMKGVFSAVIVSEHTEAAPAATEATTE